MRLTRHNGRAGKHGTYNPKHNDRSFDLENSEHINAELAKKNVYWDCYNGFRSLAKEELLADTFEEVEEMFYSSQYRNHVESQNQRNEKNRHPERNRTTSDLLKNKKTAPEETIFQIGTIDNHVPPEILLQVVTDFLVELDTRFGKNVHILDWALHLDEGTPHIHERHVFDCENSYGEVAPQQEKALEELGFELPDPTQKPSKINNRKKTFDSVCRVILFNITKKYGLDLEEEPEYGGRAYLEKQDYILMKQKQQMEQQEKKLEELTVKIEDIETLVDEVADVAYDKALSQPLVWGWGAHTPMELYNIYHTGTDSDSAEYSPYANETVDHYMDEALQADTLEDSYDLWKKAQWDGENGVTQEGDIPWIWLVNIDHLYWSRKGLHVADQKLHPHGHGWSIVNNVDQWTWE